jgi:hypothetical protein
MSGKTEYRVRPVKWIVGPQGEPIFSERNTEIEIDDESGGEYVRLRQHNDEADGIAMDPDEWNWIYHAINEAFDEIEKGKASK